MLSFLRKIPDLLFPPLCLSCGNILPEPFPLLCGDCAALLSPRGEFVCSSCGKRVAEGNPARRPVRQSFSGGGSLGGGGCHPGSVSVFAAFSYESEPARRLIHALKYEGTEAAADSAAHLVAPLLLRALSGVSEPRISFVPIPLYPARERKRGFNQSARFAEALAGELGKAGRDATVLQKALRRIRDAKSQTECKTVRERASNVEGCFFEESAEELSGSLVFLVDDVVTSGATIEEAARTLKNAGVPHVAGLAIAKT